MKKYILFSILGCDTCLEIKKHSRNSNVMDITLPLDLKEWTENDKAFVDAYDVFIELQETVSILVDTETDKHYTSKKEIEEILNETQTKK